MNYTIEPWATKVLDPAFRAILDEQTALDLNFAAQYDIQSQLKWERQYVLWIALQEAKHLAGNFVQCGVYKGEQAFFMAKQTDKTVYLYDSFEGSIDGGEFDNDFYKGSPFKSTIEDCQETLAQFNNIDITVGRVPTGFDKVGQISLLYVDVNLYEPTKISIEQLWPKIVDNGLLMVDTHDDYSTGATKAVTEFAASIGKEIQMLPTGIAVITK
jgi:O-methyltransferase